MLHLWMVELRAHDLHGDGASTVSALVLREVVTPGEFLTAIGALERLVVSVERAVVALKVLLAAEAAGAEGANEGLGRVLS
jgi:hypothetical protein